MKEQFERAKMQGPAPDGVYEAILRSFEFIEGKNGVDIYLKVWFDHAHSDYEGQQESTFHSMTDPDRLDWLKTHLSRLGLDAESPGFNLADVHPGSPLLEGLLDRPYQIAIKTSKKLDKEGLPYRNVYVNKCLGPPVVSDVPVPEITHVAQPKLDDDDDIPF